MEQPVLVDVKVITLVGKICDLITFRVPEGREDMWTNAAQLWADSLRADACNEPGLVKVLVPRRISGIPTDPNHALQGITTQYATNIGRTA